MEFTNPLHSFSNQEKKKEETRLKEIKLNTLSSLVLDAKLGMHVASAHTSVVGQDAHEAGGEVAGLVVGVQELDVCVHSRGGGVGGSIRTRMGSGC